MSTNKDDCVSIPISCSITGTGVNNSNILSSTTTHIYSTMEYTYFNPILVKYEVLEDRVEFLFKQNRCSMYWPNNNSDETTTYKEVISWKNGKTVKTRIDGVYIPPIEESYEF